MRCVLRVSREFYPTRRHGAKPGHRPTLSVVHAVSPATRNAKPSRRTRTFPILWDMIVTGRTRMWLEDEVGTNKDKLRRWRSSRPIIDRPPPSFSRPAKSLALPLAKKPPIFYPVVSPFMDDAWERSGVAPRRLNLTSFANAKLGRLRGIGHPLRPEPLLQVLLQPWNRSVRPCLPRAPMS